MENACLYCTSDTGSYVSFFGDKSLRLCKQTLLWETLPAAGHFRRPRLLNRDGMRARHSTTPPSRGFFTHLSLALAVNISNKCSRRLSGKSGGASSAFRPGPPLSLSSLSVSPVGGGFPSLCSAHLRSAIRLFGATLAAKSSVKFLGLSSSPSPFTSSVKALNFLIQYQSQNHFMSFKLTS